MRKILLAPNSCLPANSKKNKQKGGKRIVFINNGRFIYPVLFEIEGDGGPFSINPDDRDPDEMTEEAFRRRYLGR